jgi:hypothetical protein
MSPIWLAPAPGCFVTPCYPGRKKAFDKGIYWSGYTVLYVLANGLTMTSLAFLILITYFSSRLLLVQLTMNMQFHSAFWRNQHYLYLPVSFFSETIAQVPLCQPWLEVDVVGWDGPRFMMDVIDQVWAWQTLVFAIAGWVGQVREMGDWILAFGR